MRYHNITKDDMNNGNGLRVVLWLSGCEHACKGCQNPITWDPESGLAFDKTAREEVYELLKKDYIDGITLSGGDPLYPANRDEVLVLLKDVKDKFPGKTVWVYTGYTYEQIYDLPHLEFVDVLVDGLYVEDVRDVTMHWAGSTNQRVIDVRASKKEGRVVIV